MCWIYVGGISVSASTMIFAAAKDGESIGYAGAFTDHIGGCGKKTPYPPYDFSEADKCGLMVSSITLWSFMLAAITLPVSR